MLKSSTIRFTTDTFGDALEPVDEESTPTTDTEPEAPQTAFYKKALLTYKKPFDFTNKTAVDRFVITGNEPEGSRRRIIFKIDDQLYRFRNGSLQAYTWGGELDDILVYGNRVSVLEALENVNAFVGKKVYPIVALRAPYDADDMPTIALAIESRANADQLTNVVDSPIYEIADGDAQVVTSISYKPVCTGNGSVEVTARLRDSAGWSDYMEITEVIGKAINAIQFKFKYIVTTTDGTDSASVESVTINYASGQAVVTGGTARLFSKVRDYEVDLQTCYVVVRHEPLVDSTITAYVNFMNAPKHRNFLRIGIGTGSRQELLLGTASTPDKKIVASSIKIYQDSKLVEDFDFSAELSTVALSAKKNSTIYASYDYDYGPENWLEMSPRLLQPYNDDNGTYVSRFFLNLNPADAIGKRVSNVQIRLKRLSGTATETLGVATGRTQLFTLEHNAVPSSINFSEDVDFSFDEDSGILSCVATAGTILNVSYNWQGKNTVVYSFAAGWVPASGFEYQEGDYQHSLIGGDGSDYELPTMSTLIKGGAKVGTGLAMADDTLNVDLSTAITNDTIGIDAEPRTYVLIGADSNDFRTILEELPDPDNAELVHLLGVENHTYFPYNGVYYAVVSATPQGGLFHTFDEVYFPVRGQENLTVRGSGYYFDEQQEERVDVPTRDLVAGQDYFIGLDDRENGELKPFLAFSHDGQMYPADWQLDRATIWADGHNASQTTTSAVANLIIGDNLSLTGNTLSAAAMNAAIDIWGDGGTATVTISDSDGDDKVELVETDNLKSPKEFEVYEFDSEFGNGAGKYFVHEYDYYGELLSCNPLVVHKDGKWYFLDNLDAVVNFRRNLFDRIAQLESRIAALERT